MICMSSHSPKSFWFPRSPRRNARKERIAAPSVGLTFFGAVALLLLPAAAPLFAQSMTGEEILRESDARLLPPNCEYRLQLDTVEDDGSRRRDQYTGYKKGDDRNVMIVREPRRFRGSVHMRNGVVIYEYTSTDQRTRQKAYSSVFMGSLLNYGDVMSTALSYDYNVVDTQEDDTYYILTLRPKPGHEGYDMLKVFVRKNNLVPEIREFYALSGELMKTAVIEQLRREGNRTVYMRQRYFEPLSDKTSIAVYSDIVYRRPEQIPDRYFNEGQIRFIGQ